MKILVCISKAPDTTSKIAFKDNNSKFDENGVQFIINPYDEWYALVKALELTENSNGHVTLISVGGIDYEPIIRKALAIGANDAVRINAEPTDALFVAKQIADYAKNEGFDLILTGKETIDFNSSSVGAMLAGLLDLPYISLASKLNVSGNIATVETDIQGGTQVLEVQLPAVISAAKGMAEARIPNMRGIMASRSKPLSVIEATANDNLLKLEQFSLPAEKKGCKYIAPENAGELIDLLHNEAKVI
ncbi:MAG: electron transfer flavoprotein subunit beta/FixA family protein [Bacteroidia bacterium]|nr:electron transfer flavoprotein subunit beta/FixA family protein [Bacteroidia bacterium]